MRRPANIDPSAFFLDGGPVGALLIHGFTGAAIEMRPLGDYLNHRGLTISGPLLPGHGTQVEDLMHRKSEEWIRTAEESLTELQSRCSAVFIVGFSMGSLLGFHLAANQRDNAGVIAIAPPLALDGWRRRLLPVARPFVRHIPKTNEFYANPEAVSRLWHYDTYPTQAVGELMALIPMIKQELPMMTCPLLIIYSSGDPRAEPKGAIEAFELAGSPDKEIVELHKSGHAITVDVEWEIAAEKIYQFIARRAPDIS